MSADTEGRRAGHLARGDEGAGRRGEHRSGGESSSSRPRTGGPAGTAAWKRWAGRGLRALVAGLVVYVIVGWLEPRMVFFPLAGEQQTPETLGLSWRRVPIRTADGETLTAWWIERPDARADVIHFHGNGGNLALWLPVLAAIHGRGVNVLAFDYRGYGTSTGHPTERGLQHDTEAVLATWSSTLRGARPVIYWGRSLGGPVAAYAASRQAPGGLVLEATFPDKASVVRTNPVLRVLNLFARYRFDTLAAARDLTCPVLVIHGDADSVIPFYLGQELFAGLRGPKEFVRVPGADHNDVEPRAPEYWLAIDGFIGRVVAGR